MTGLAPGHQSYSRTMQVARANMSWSVGSLLLALVGCGKAVELDHPGEVMAGNDPNVLGILHERVVQLRVDEESLYWLTEFGAIRGCDKRSCASSVTTYTEGASPFGSFLVQGGELFYNGYREVGVMALSLADPTLTRVLALHVDPYAFALDRDHLYAGSAQQIQVFGLGARAEAAPVSIPAGGVDSFDSFAGDVIAAGGGYVYWFEVGGSVARLKRARTDGAAPPETLVASVKIDPSYGPPDPNLATTSLGLAVDDSYVYWSENVLAGSIKRVPVAGGASEPETVSAPIRTPMGLVLDGSSLYVEHETDAYEFVVSSCLLDSCTPQALASGLATTNAFVVDSEYLYTATTSQSLELDGPPRNPLTVLRRSSKKLTGPLP